MGWLEPLEAYKQGIKAVTTLILSSASGNHVLYSITSKKIYLAIMSDDHQETPNHNRRVYCMLPML